MWAGTGYRSQNSQKESIEPKYFDREKRTNLS